MDDVGKSPKTPILHKFKICSFIGICDIMATLLGKNKEKKQTEDREIAREYFTLPDLLEKRGEKISVSAYSKLHGLTNNEDSGIALMAAETIVELIKRDLVPETLTKVNFCSQAIYHLIVEDNVTPKIQKSMIKALPLLVEKNVFSKEQAISMLMGVLNSKRTLEIKKIASKTAAQIFKMWASSKQATAKTETTLNISENLEKVPPYLLDLLEKQDGQIDYTTYENLDNLTSNEDGFIRLIAGEAIIELIRKDRMPKTLINGRFCYNSLLSLILTDPDANVRKSMIRALPLLVEKGAFGKEEAINMVCDIFNQDVPPSLYHFASKAGSTIFRSHVENLLTPTK